MFRFCSVFLAAHKEMESGNKRLGPQTEFHCDHCFCALLVRLEACVVEIKIPEERFCEDLLNSRVTPANVRFVQEKWISMVMILCFPFCGISCFCGILRNVKRESRHIARGR